MDEPVVGGAGGETQAPQQQTAEEPGDGDVHVHAVRAGQSYGHDSIQHGPGAARLIPGKGPQLHLSMYRDFLTADDESGDSRREPGRRTDSAVRSES